MTKAACSPGSHPHSDHRNWRPAETIGDYLANCRDGLEEYSDRRAAKHLGFSRVRLWRCKLMAEIPGELFDRLMRIKPQPSSKTLALIGGALSGGKAGPDVKCCPHCGGMLRLRRRISAEAAKVINDWFAERGGRA